jgi:hypothetical protein
MMKVLDYEQAHNVVEANRSLYWDGWDIVSWVRNPNGATNIKGKFRNGKWGISRRYSLNSDGTWKVPNKYAN